MPRQHETWLCAVCAESPSCNDITWAADLVAGLENEVQVAVAGGPAAAGPSVSVCGAAGHCRVSDSTRHLSVPGMCCGARRCDQALFNGWLRSADLVCTHPKARCCVSMSKPSWRMLRLLIVLADMSFAGTVPWRPPGAI